MFILELQWRNLNEWQYGCCTKNSPQNQNWNFYRRSRCSLKKGSTYVKVDSRFFVRYLIKLKLNQLLTKLVDSSVNTCTVCFEKNHIPILIPSNASIVGLTFLYYQKIKRFLVFVQGPDHLVLWKAFLCQERTFPGRKYSINTLVD